MSLSGILNSARAGMNAQQTALQISSQNIANAQTPGYSRETAQLVAALPTVFPYGAVGTGVDVKTITRARDAMLDANFRQDSAASTGAQTKADGLSQVQDVFGEPSDTGLGAALDQFWNAWSDLSTDPTNSAAKSVALESGSNLAGTLNRFAGQINSLDDTNRQAMAQDISQVNSLASQIGKLNEQIVSAQAGGQPANDLADARDNLLDQVSSLVGGQIVQHDNGSVAVYVGGQMLVDGTSVKSLQMSNATPPTVSISGNSTSLVGLNGDLGAKLDLSTTQFPGVMSQLNALASTLVTQVNAIHSSGVVFSGNPPVSAPAGNFFLVTNPPPSGGDLHLTAAGITVDPSLTAANVSSSGGSATGVGDNGTAEAIANLRTAAVNFTTPSGTTQAAPGDYFQGLISNLATNTQEAQDDATVQSTLTSNADTRRQAVSGVSTDEELVNVIQYQHAYAAAARLVSVVDQMADTLVNLGT